MLFFVFFPPKEARFRAPFPSQGSYGQNSSTSHLQHAKYAGSWHGQHDGNGEAVADWLQAPSEHASGADSPSSATGQTGESGFIDQDPRPKTHGFVVFCLISSSALSFYCMSCNYWCLLRQTCTAVAPHIFKTNDLTWRSLTSCVTISGSKLSFIYQKQTTNGDKCDPGPQNQS